MFLLLSPFLKLVDGFTQFRYIIVRFCWLLVQHPIMLSVVQNTEQYWCYTMRFYILMMLEERASQITRIPTESLNIKHHFASFLHTYDNKLFLLILAKQHLFFTHRAQMLLPQTSQHFDAQGCSSFLSINLHHETRKQQLSPEFIQQKNMSFLLMLMCRILFSTVLFWLT